MLVYIKSPTYLVMIKISYQIHFRHVDVNGVMGERSILLCLSTEQEHGTLCHTLQLTSFIGKAEYNSEPKSMR